MPKKYEPEELPEDLLSGLNLDSPTQVFLSLRQQNLDLLRLAVQTAGFGEGKASIKPDEKRQAMERVWEIYSEFYEWIDPEADDEDEEEA